MLEADAVDGVVEFDVDAEVVTVELELIAGPQPGVFIEVRRQRRYRAVESQLPVPVSGWIGLVIDGIISHC